MSELKKYKRKQQSRQKKVSFKINTYKIYNNKKKSTRISASEFLCFYVLCETL